MLIPVLSVESSGLSGDSPDAALVSTVADVARRFGVTGRVCVRLGGLDVGVSAAKPAYLSASCVIGTFSLSDVDTVIPHLNAGAAVAVFSLEDGDTGAAVAALEGLPASRVGVAVPVAGAGEDDVAKVTAVVAGVKGKVGMVVVTGEGAAAWAGLGDDVLKSFKGVDLVVDGVETLDHVAKLHRCAISSQAPAFVGHPESRVSSIVRGAAASADSDDTGTGADAGAGAGAGTGTGPALDVGAAFAACARTDRPDNLFTTVVTDERGIALGLVYSSLESIQEAIATERGVYYSRSRGGLWRKGDTSGAIQELVSAAVDCDSDAVLFKVRQLGNPPAFCHLNTRTCWGEDGGLSKLERVLASRRASAPAGSYTKRLFDDPELLRHKLLEEAQELSEATEPDHIAAEAADVMYFALVRCAAAGVPISAIEAHLDRRSLKLSRRPGNAKASRIKAAEEILKKSTKDA